MKEISFRNSLIAQIKRFQRFSMVLFMIIYCIASLHCNTNTSHCTVRTFLLFAYYVEATVTDIVIYISLKATTKTS